MKDFTKSQIALRYWLLGREWYTACEALDFAATYHKGTRKDGHTPEFAHQIAIANHVRTLSTTLLYPEESVCIALLHDCREDYGVADEEIESRFGELVASGVDAMTKTFRGVERDPAEVFAAIGAHPCASIAKACDRIHNQSSMVGVFSSEKIRAYIDETETYFLPMLKVARRAFPTQEPAVENLRVTLDAQVSFAKALIAK